MRRLPGAMRFSINLTEPVYDRLPTLNEPQGLRNNYLLSVILKWLDVCADAEKLDAAFRCFFIAQYDAHTRTKEET